MNSPTGRAGIIRARDDDGTADKLAHGVLDDVLYNVISDLLMKAHQDEKTAKANSAAIRVEKLASDASDSSTPDSKPEVRVETDAAVYEDGRVLLKGNPLKTTQDILCPKCHLPRLLYPNDGKGARKLDPAVIYCKKYPYIEKPGCDIYGQSWVAPGPGRGKKKDVDKKADGTGSPVPEQRSSNVLSFPSATCSKCKRCILVTRLNNHMGSCIGNSGRNASRAAAQKLNNGGSQADSTPPSSQKATPAPGSRPSSPRKREASDDEADSDNSHKKKKYKAGSAVMTKKLIRAKPSLKKEKTKSASHLSKEQKVDDPDGPNLGPSKPKPPKDASPMKKVKAAKHATSSPMSKNGCDADGESESSGTLSSPPAGPK